MTATIATAGTTIPLDPSLDRAYRLLWVMVAGDVLVLWLRAHTP